MSPTHKRRLVYVTILIGAAVSIVALVLFALNQNINLYYTPNEVAKGQAPANKRIRVGGLVVNNSIQRQEGLAVSFTVTDFLENLTIEYKGILPDLFKEGQGVVALGRLTSPNVFQAEQILAKHDENYMPPEVAESLKLATKEDS